MKKLLFLLFSLTLSYNFAFGQGALACNDSLQVSVDDQCVALITPDMILEGTYADYNDYDVRIYNTMPNPINSPGTVANPVAVGDYIVGVFDKVNYVGNNCWSKITVLDKMPPTIECDCPAGGALPAESVFDNPFDESFSAKDDSGELPDNCDAYAAALGIEDGSHYFDVFAINF